MGNDDLRLMQVIGSKKAGGAEAFFVRFVHQLAQQADVLPVVRQNSWVAQQLDGLQVDYVALPFGGLFDRKTRKGMRSLISRYKPSVVQTWMNRASRFLPRRCGKAVCVGRLGGYYNLKYYRRMHYLAGNTHDICTYITKQGWPEDKVVYLPNFAQIPDNNFAEHRHHTRAALGLTENDFAILVAARLHPNKGIDTAIKALAALPAQAHLVVAGEGPLQEELIHLAQQQHVGHRVHFLGWVNNISPVAAGCDVWLVPSRHEPLGNVVLEAWAHRLPVVAADTKGPVSLIEDREDGMLVPVDHPSSMASALSQLMAQPQLRQKLSARGFNKFMDLFAPQVVVGKYMDFYRNIVQKQQG